MRFIRGILSQSLLAVAFGCAALPPAGKAVVENSSRVDSETLQESQTASVADQLKVGQYCRFVFTEDLPVPPPGPSFDVTLPFESPIARIKEKIGGRVVSIKRDRVLLAEVMQIIDPWTPSPSELILIPSQLFKKRKQFALQPWSGNSAEEMVFSLRQISEVKSMDRQTWATYCETAYRKPAPMHFTVNQQPVQ